MNERAPTENDFVVFDYDGTAAPDGGGMVPPDDAVIADVDALWNVGIPTSVITTRPYQRLAMACGSNGGGNKLVSPYYPLATERGGRIVGSDQDTNIEYAALSRYELDAIADIKNVEDIDFVGFYPKELKATSYIWGGNPARQDELADRFGSDAIVLPSNRQSLRHALDAAQSCLVKFRFSSHSNDRAALEPGLNVAWNKRIAEVIPDGVDKYSALGALCTIVGKSLNTVRYAGNDANDLPVLRLRALRERILVGQEEFANVAQPVTRVADPAALGSYFLHIAKAKAGEL